MKINIKKILAVLVIVLVFAIIYIIQAYFGARLVQG